EDPRLALATDPAQRVVVVRTRVLLLGLVLRAHGRVVHARKHAEVAARVELPGERVRLVHHAQWWLAPERRVERVVGLLDLDRDHLAVIPMELEDATDEASEFGPGAHDPVGTELGRGRLDREPVRPESGGEIG